MSRSKLIIGVVSASFLLSVIPAKKVIDNNIKKNFSKEATVNYFLNDFPFKLTPENEKKANEVILRLYKDKAVFEKVSAYSRFHDQSREKILEMMKGNLSTSSLDSATKLLDLQKERFSLFVKDLVKNPQTARNLDTLFNVFSTSSSFRNKFTLDLVQTQLKKNPLYLIDKGFLLKKKPQVDLSSIIYNHRSKVKGFNQLYQRDINSKLIPRLPIKKIDSIPQKKPEVRRRPGR